MDMTTQGKLEACDGFRSEGNAFYREGQYHRAGDRYRKVDHIRRIQLYRPIPPGPASMFPHTVAFYSSVPASYTRTVLYV